MNDCLIWQVSAISEMICGSFVDTGVGFSLFSSLSPLFLSFHSKNISLKILQTCFSTRTSFPETKCFPMPSPCAFTAPNYTLWGAYTHISFRKEVDDIVFEVDCQKIVVKPGVDIDIGALRNNEKA